LGLNTSLLKKSPQLVGPKNPYWENPPLLNKPKRPLNSPKERFSEVTFRELSPIGILPLLGEISFGEKPPRVFLTPY